VTQARHICRLVRVAAADRRKQIADALLCARSDGAVDVPRSFPLPIDRRQPRRRTEDFLNHQWYRSRMIAGIPRQKLRRANTRVRCSLSASRSDIGAGSDKTGRRDGHKHNPPPGPLQAICSRPARRDMSAMVHAFPRNAGGSGCGLRSGFRASRLSDGSADDAIQGPSFVGEGAFDGLLTPVRLVC